ncbi:MAG: hypothetical protein QF486_06245 [Candidatus Woesearchaeota archaeon]|jgi:hypothetical protein|nr:hypothetical protein [Candidatus Woesearchaeota archaeon]MDP7180876.1 hypothetical protein [Candidatus Woesearchaeota archaeon]MDP7199186.1 hypothetical protein [Candidatus Woesearchaeota archaeon]MDP7467551.1 hypothetical protein [Candidatus Woesearchaeota archaeon]MDP7647033.1 hypothetical protein [Candidatus Woesearchaeota archaeon]
MGRLTWQELTAAMLAALFLILWLGFGSGFGSKLEASVDANRCKADVYANAFAAVGSARFSQEFNCPTTEIFIKTEDPLPIKRTVARAMHSCWDTFGYGKLDLFEGDGVFCHLCSTIGFEKEQEVKGMLKYLHTAKVRAGKTYAQSMSPAFSGTDAALDALGDQIKQGDVLDTSQQYAVVFVYARGRGLGELVAHYSKKGLSYGVGGTMIVIGLKTSAAGLASVFTGVGAAPGLVGIGGGIIISLGGAAVIAWNEVFGGEDSDTAAYLQLIPFESEALKGLQCKSLISTR